MIQPVTFEAALKTVLGVYMVIVTRHGVWIDNWIY
jgi:hypothetical protein